MTWLDRPALSLSGQQKITPHHLKRLACIYIRQSSSRQVLHNRESQVNQYQLAQRAAALGWSQDRIRVIDSDLGLSGRDAASRSGFKELVAEVSLGYVGIIFGYEVSRLARNNSDWYHLLDLAAVFGTLIADSDGIYDSHLFNDRLLLGLKGTMSEAELHLLHLRLEAGRMRQIERGEYRQNLPTGLVRLSDSAVVKDPDDQVRHTIELVFAKFEELGSCRQVLHYLREAQILLPRRQTHGPHIGEMLWKQPTDAAVGAIITNPAYAGAFAYGRTQSDPTRRTPGRPDTGLVRKPMEEWIHLQRDVYPAYITWEQYLVHQERLRQNATRFTESTSRAQGSARKGAALLQGLVVCGDCGYRMQVEYKPSPYYVCGELKRRFGEPICRSLHGVAIDEAVVQAFFEAIQPAQLDALEAILAEQEAERDRLAQQWRERLKRARYEAHLAERRYNAVDPNNRLVVAELERRWEEKLRQLQTTQEAYERFQHTSEPLALPPELREQFHRISDALPDLWNSGQLSNDQKKELLRSLISSVILKRLAPGSIEVKIVWVSGHYSMAYAYSPIYRACDVPGYEEMVQRVHQLWQQELNDEHIAAQLTAEGFRSARSLEVYPSMVQKIRLDRGWKWPPGKHSQLLELEGYVTITRLAQRLGVNRSWVYRRIRNRKIDPSCVMRHPRYNAILIRDDTGLNEELQQELAHRQRANGGI